MRRSLAILAAIVAVVAVAAFAGARYVRSHALAMIHEKYGDAVQVSDLHVELFPRITIRTGRVIVQDKDRPEPVPLIEIRNIAAETNWISALRGNVNDVRLEGLKITVPPRRDGSTAEPKPHKDNPPHFRIGRIVADGTVLTVLPKKAGKDPLQFDIYKLTLHGAGPDQAMTFQAVLKNAKPPGEIQTRGKFGPWNDEPAGTPVSGTYTFRDADLGVFKGISGKLSSEGNYQGTLDQIHVEGRTDTPDFALRVARHAVHLTTEFRARVDGTDGNTYLDSVNGHFGNTPVETRGKVEKLPGATGKTVSLDGIVNGGSLRDILWLAVPSNDPPMNGAISFRSKIVIPPGDIDVIEKLQLDGVFAIGHARFSKLDVQEKVNELSHRGQGEPEAPPTDTVASNFRGRFKLANGTMTFTNLNFDVPGVAVALDGTYGMLDRKLDMRGTARLNAKLSQTTTGFKSVLLKAIDGFFSHKSAGAVLPIKVSGTSDSPSFGLSLRG